MTVENKKSGTEVAQSNNPKNSVRGTTSKTHAAYWKPRLIKRHYLRDGVRVDIPNWQIRIRHRGRREWINLQTSNADVAAEKARTFYLTLVASGWEEALKKFKPAMGGTSVGCTVEEFLADVKNTSGLKARTYECYARKFRGLVAGAFGINGGKAKHDYVNGGYEAWLKRVNSVRLHRLTPERVNRWQVRYLRDAGSNPLRLKHAKATVRSILRSCKALFSPKLRQNLTVPLPTPLPFSSVIFPKGERCRYKSQINPGVLLRKARADVDQIDPNTGEPLLPMECFKILVLALGAGLRRAEIDTLQWSQIDWERHIIRVETTEYASVKSPESEAEVLVDGELLQILREGMPKSGHGSRFVIESKNKPRPNTTYQHYRCDRLFKQLLAWLRVNGVPTRTPLHTMRKEFGSQICAVAGIMVASAALRHSDIRVTREHYIDTKQMMAFPMGALLSAGGNDIGKVAA